MATRLQEAERAYFVRKLGGTQLPTRPLHDIEREYFAKILGNAVNTATTSFKELQIRWMRSVLATAAVAAVTDYDSELWKLMVISISQTPARTINQNQIIFYTNAS